MAGRISMASRGVTMTDIAKLADVSQSTVSLILNGKTSSVFPQETVDKVLAAAKQLNYRIKSSQSQSVREKNKSIMVFAVKMANPYYSNMLQSIESEAVLKGYNVLSCNTYHNAESEASYLNMAIEQQFTGVIFLYPPDNIQAFLTAASQIPVIAICDRASQIDTDIVELDNFKAGSLAAEHLVSLGHKNIALLTNPPEGNTGRLARIEGINSVLEKHGLSDHLIIRMLLDTDLNKSIENIHYDYHVGYSLAQDKKLYESGITAFVCINDMLAYGLIEAMNEKGYKIPEDFSVISFDNLLYSGFSSISLTTIDHHMEVVGRYAIGVLLQKITAASRSNKTTDIFARFKVECPPSLIVRNSTKKIN
jgi:LacI family transcriptional regulator